MSRRDARPPGRGPVLAAVISLALASTAGAATPGDAVMAGIGGVHRTGAWTPLVVPRGGAATEAVRAWVADADGQFVGSPPTQATAEPAARLCVRPGRPVLRAAIAPVEPGQGGGSPAPDLVGLADRATPVPGTAVASTTRLVLVHGDLPAASAALRLVAGERPPAVPVSLTAAPIPARLTPRELDAFDEAVICGSELPTLPGDTLAAIDGWVRAGGRLVFIAGESAVAVAAGGPPAADWLPGTAPRLAPLRRFGGIEAFARAGGLAARSPPDGARVPLFATRRSPGGVVEVFEGSATEQPLVIRRAHGLGTITWLGLDVDAAWAAAWPGSDRLLAALLRGQTAGEQRLTVADFGRPRVPDLAGQLRVALDTFPPPDAALGVPFEVLAGLGLLYAVALYPLDWWIVSRVGRPWLAWLTLPALAGGFTAATWAIAGQWGHRSPPRLRAAEVLDIDVAGGLVRGSAWVAVSSPANAAVDVSLAASAATATAADVAVSWFADSGAGFGGVDAATPHPSLAAGDYAYGAGLDELVGAPIAAASSRLFEAGWTATAPAAAASATLVRDGRGLLRGTLVNRLPVTLRNCRLLHAGWLYDIGDLEPGEQFDTEAGRGPRSLAAALTRRTAVGDRDQAERWDTASVDVSRILEVAGFHAAAGGEAYTGVTAGRLGRLDLSPLLTVDRAIVVGVAPDGFRGAAWDVRLRGDAVGAVRLPPEAADSGTLVRIVLPLPEATEETP